MKRLVIALFGLVTGAGAFEIHASGNPVRVHLGVVKRGLQEEYLLTRDAPLVFSVSDLPDTGVWVRVSTRLWWGNQPRARVGYTILVQRRDSLRRIHLETGVSDSTVGPALQRVGRVRSFFLRITPPDTGFKILLDSAPSDTAAVRVTVEAPPRWSGVVIPGKKELTVVSRRKTPPVRRSGYLEILRNQPCEFTVSGPGRFRLRVRLNFEPGMRGEQVFVIQVKEGENLLAENTLRVKRALKTHYEGLKGVIPSIERRLEFPIGPGVHKLKVELLGTVAKSGVIKIEKLDEKK